MIECLEKIIMVSFWRINVKRRICNLLICIGMLCCLAIFLFLILPRVLIGSCEIEEYYPKTVYSKENECVIVLTGQGLGQAVYINDRRLKGDSIIEQTEDYVKIRINIEDYEEQSELNIHFKSEALFWQKSKKVKLNIIKEKVSIEKFDDTLANGSLQENVDELNPKEYMLSYLSALKDTDYRIYIAICDEAGKLLDDDMMLGLQALGMQTDLRGKYRNSYIGVFQDNNSIFEQLSAEHMVIYSDNFADVLSAGFDVGNQAGIWIGGQEQAVGSRGINIVVYDEEANVIVDSVVFDICMGCVFQRNE